MTTGCGHGGHLQAGSRLVRPRHTVVCRFSIHNTLTRLWGLLWGCSFKLLVVNSEMLGNAERIDPGDGPRLESAKLAAVSNIAQCVGTLSKELSSCVLMNLHGC